MLISFLFCSNHAFGQENAPSALRIMDVTRIAAPDEGFTEPSGLAIAEDGEHLWSVSDDTGRIYLMDLDGKLDVSRSITVHLSDIEGITEDPANDRLLAIREGSSEIVEIWPTEGRAIRHGLAGMRGFDALTDAFPDDADHGLEGVTVDPKGERIFLLKESNPRLLLEVSSALDAVLRVVELSPDLGFRSDVADDETLDVSGLAYDVARGGLWIVSDTGRAVFFFDLEEMRAIPFPMTTEKHFRNAEGIALKEDGRTLLIVTDDGKDSRLFTLEID